MIYDFSIYFFDELVTDVHMNLETSEVYMTKYVLGMKQPFMAERCDVTYVYDFLKSRCFNDARPDLPEILKVYGMKSNDPYEFCRKSHGVMYKDFWWLKYPGEDIKWDDINPRISHSEERIIVSVTAVAE